MGADVGFVHLHVHSSYSLLEGALTISRLAELAKADRQPALALFMGMIAVWAHVIAVL